MLLKKVFFEKIDLFFPIKTQKNGFTNLLQYGILVILCRGEWILPITSEFA